MINRLSNPINRNRSAAKISKVMSSINYPTAQFNQVIIDGARPRIFEENKQNRSHQNYMIIVMITRMSIVFTTIITSHQTWSSGWVILLARALTGVFSLKMGQSIFQFEGYFILHSRFSLMEIAIVLLGFTDCLSVGVGFQYISEVSELRNRWKPSLFCRYECHYLGLDWINGAKLKASQLQ